MAVPVLKEQLATLVGVPAGSQRLICRGKVLKDDHLLSAYSILLFPPLLPFIRVNLVIRQSWLGFCNCVEFQFSHMIISFHSV